MGRRGALVALAIALLGALVACEADGTGSAERPAARHPPERERGPRVDTRATTITGLETILAHPHRRGSRPLVVFVHGAGAAPLFYLPFLQAVAASGYTVVAPAVPGTAAGGLGALPALPFLPGRIHDLVTAVTSGPGRLPAADPARVAVMGHDLGGAAGLALGYNSCCLDGRVDAVVSIAGDPAAFPTGQYGSNATPLLAIHGNQDAVVAYVEGRRSLGFAHPAYLLTVEGGDHAGYLSPEDDAYPAVYRSVVSFLDAVFGRSPGASLALLDAAGRLPGVRLERRA